MTGHGTEGLVSRFGQTLIAGPIRRAFPAPEQLAALDKRSLRSAAGLGYRAPCVLLPDREPVISDYPHITQESNAWLRLGFPFGSRSPVITPCLDIVPRPGLCYNRGKRQGRIARIIFRPLTDP